MIRIKEALNGWIVTHYPENEDEKERTFAFSYMERGEDDLESFANMLRCINDLVGPMPYKHSGERIYVTVKTLGSNEKRGKK